jgi:hypothetical protein
MMSSRFRKLSGYRRYQRTHRTMISASKCRPLNSVGCFGLMQTEAYQTGSNGLQHILRCYTVENAGELTHVARPP